MDTRQASVALVGFSPDAVRRVEALARVVGARCVTLDSGSPSPARSVRALLAAAPICAEDVSALRRAFPAAAVLAYDSDSSQESAIAALRAGADDYIDARKGDTLCVVGAPMFMAKALRDAGEAAQQQRLGTLCNKVFSAL